MIEGRDFDFSVEFPDQKPLTAKQLKQLKMPEPSTKLLVELLQSDIPLTPAMRRWLADLLDETAKTDLQLKFGQRRAGQTKLSHWQKRVRLRHAALTLDKLLSEGHPKKNAIYEISRQFSAEFGYGCSKRTIESAHRNLRAAGVLRESVAAQLAAHRKQSKSGN
jgi:hypothetical protein